VNGTTHLFVHVCNVLHEERHERVDAVHEATAGGSSSGGRLSVSGDVLGTGTVGWGVTVGGPVLTQRKQKFLYAFPAFHAAPQPVGCYLTHTHTQFDFIRV
jgi:hypothetical protein